MIFINDVDKEEYESFLEEFKLKNHFLQSTMWGELKKNPTLIPRYVGIKKNNKLIAGALILQKKLPFGYSHFYSPRGPVLDYNDGELLKFFTKSVKKYIKDNKGIYLKIDPDIKREEKSVFNTLIKMGYKHKGFNLNFENSQPRFTFRMDINKPYEEVYNSFDRSIKKSITKSNRYVTNMYMGTIDDIDIFNTIMKTTEKRKGFYSHDESYYKNFLKVFKDNAKLFIATIDIEKSIVKLRELIEQLNSDINNIKGQGKKSDNKRNEYQVQINDLNNDISKLIELKKIYPNIVPVSAYIISYYSNKGWVLYGGNLGDFMFTSINYLLYEYHIKYAIDNKIEIYDLFGCTSPDSNEKQLLGLYNFKRKFGGELVEFIGEFDLIIHPVMYTLFTKLVPIYRKFINKKLKSK